MIKLYHENDVIHITNIYTKNHFHSHHYVHVKASANNLYNDVSFEQLIEHALSCTSERVNKDVSYVNGLKFGMIDEGCLIEATSGEEV